MHFLTALTVVGHSLLTARLGASSISWMDMFCMTIHWIRWKRWIESSGTNPKAWRDRLICFGWPRIWNHSICVVHPGAPEGRGIRTAPPKTNHGVIRSGIWSHQIAYGVLGSFHSSFSYLFPENVYMVRIYALLFTQVVCRYWHWLFSSAFWGGGVHEIFNLCNKKIRNGLIFERDLRGYIFLYFFRLTHTGVLCSFYIFLLMFWALSSTFIERCLELCPNHARKPCLRFGEAWHLSSTHCPFESLTVPINIPRPDHATVAQLLDHHPQSSCRKFNTVVDGLEIARTAWLWRNQSG